MKMQVAFVLTCALLLGGCGGGVAGIAPSPGEDVVHGAVKVLSAPNEVAEWAIDGAARVAHEKTADALATEVNVVGCEASATDILGSIGKAVGVLALSTTPTAIPAILSLGADYMACAGGISDEKQTTLEAAPFGADAKVVERFAFDRAVGFPPNSRQLRAWKRCDGAPVDSLPSAASGPPGA